MQGQLKGNLAGGSKGRETLDRKKHEIRRLHVFVA